MHRNARLTPRGRERIVGQVESGQTPDAVAEAAGVCPRTVGERTELRCDCIWHRSSVEFAEFDAVSRERSLTRGQGQARQVWAKPPIALDCGYHKGSWGFSS
jgi:hypothetical protein